MACDYPITAYYSRTVNPSGKRSLVFSVGASLSGAPIRLPCGRCIGCRLERARQWAMRCMHESKLHNGNRFVTLTYDDKHLPYGGSLVKRDMQLFMKRLRKAYGNGIRFFGCGEYGSSSNRPHYHILLFNAGFEDEKRCGENERGESLYRSRILEKIWPAGNNIIGDVTFDSACYVARYVCEKYTGERADEWYSKVLRDGSVVRMEPEFVLMSRRPGVGVGWFEKYQGETYVHDSVVVNCKPVRPPRYYDKRLAETLAGPTKSFEALPLGVARLADLKRVRARAIDRKEQRPERRKVKARIREANLARFKREI